MRGEVPPPNTGISATAQAKASQGAEAAEHGREQPSAIQAALTRAREKTDVALAVRPPSAVRNYKEVANIEENVNSGSGSGSGQRAAGSGQRAAEQEQEQQEQEQEQV